MAPIPKLSEEYASDFEAMLEGDARAAASRDVPLVPFWPLRGRLFDQDLLVIGRSVNGWVADWTPVQLRDPVLRRDAVAWLRRDAEPPDGDRMAWVTDLWGAATGYNTRRSAFWRVLRRISSGADLTAAWPGRLVWTNLYKVSPAAGWNPGSDLQRAQRDAAIGLLRREMAEFAPRRVLALIGGWISPFIKGPQAGPASALGSGRRSRHGWHETLGDGEASDGKAGGSIRRRGARSLRRVGCAAG